jgi:hypothetical protein
LTLNLIHFRLTQFQTNIPTYKALADEEAAEAGKEAAVVADPHDNKLLKFVQYRRFNDFWALYKELEKQVQ